MPKRDAFAEDVDDRLATLDGYRRRAMFGGHGLFQDKMFFGIVYRQRLYFRTTPATKAKYAAEGMGPLRYDTTHTMWNYYEVPATILADGDRLLEWALESIASRTEGE